jgi:hypothetical protein
MQNNSRVLGTAVGLITLAILIVGFAVVRKVLAQEQSTTTDQVGDSTPPVDTVSSSTPTDNPVDATDSLVEVATEFTAVAAAEPPTR